VAKLVLIHVSNEDPILAEMDDLPNPGDNFVVFTNPRRRDGRPVNYVTAGARTFIFPWTRISFIEVMVSEDERREVLEFFRSE
jgi:hypothetical protein